MKLTLQHITTIIEVLSSITVDNFKINYWVSRNMRYLNDSYEFMVTQRNSIYKEFLVPDENGSIISIDKETGNYKFNLKETNEEFIKQFENKMNELFNLECDVDVYSIDVDTLIKENISLNPAQISYIGCLLSE